jgi:hypothetical protein|tara:strand:- start:46 stop:342 length:297 start_codon:yes stop_codon:yes gene_type:complete
MAITKEVKQDKIEIVTDFKHIQVREQTIIKEDDAVISATYTNRYVLDPGNLDASDNLVDRDISGESTEVQAIANAVWTDAVKTSWKNKLIADKAKLEG